MKKRLALLAAACLCMAVSMTSFAADKSDIVVAVDADVDTLHPTDFSTTVELGVLNQIYDTLLYYSPDGTKDPEPRIAESYEISDDGLDYTFHLRDDVTFHDGTPVTADDVVFSIELYKASEYQGSQISMLSSVEATDEHTVVCHLDAPYSPFLQGICSPMIASKAYYESSEDDFVNNPIGSGPYKFVSRAKGSNIKLEANEDYYRGAPEIKEVTFEVIPDSSTKAIALQTGEVNFAEIDSATKPQLEANLAITIAEVPTSSFSYIAMNTEKEPFNDVKVRQAINYAIDRDNLVAVCYDGEAEVNSNICAKERFGYSDDQFQYTYDPEKAKELLAEAGIETPYDLGEILVAEKYSNLATVIQNDLKAVGLDVTISVKEFNSYISDLQNGSYGITALNMTLEGDTQTLEMAFTSDYIGIANNARYSDEEMDKLFEQARTETDNDKRAEIFNEIFTKVQDEAIYAVMCNPMTLYAYNSDLSCPEFVLEGNYYLYDFSWAE
ncbi:MAG: ABC transporter substrate-binding protein [Lachnospiraceae bacterium]|nr:ABC transporter substrate-binding protein [Lachnospiraceae bacterium]